MSQQLDQKIVDLGVWFNYHAHEQPIPKENVHGRIEFLTKSIDCIIEILAILAKDIQIMEKRDDRPRIAIPKSITLHGPIRQ